MGNLQVVGSTREDFKGDFLGFTFNGRHSSEFGLVRTSSSNRYEDKFLPNMKDKTVEIPGSDGTYYFGSYYTQKPFSISVAFDSMSQEQLEGMAVWLGDKGIHELVFDENDYKSYNVKCTGTPSLKYLCFETSEGDVYKGEGTITFTAYYPYAHSKIFNNSNLIDSSFLGFFNQCTMHPEDLGLTEDNVQAMRFFRINYSKLQYLLQSSPNKELRITLPENAKVYYGDSSFLGFNNIFEAFIFEDEIYISTQDDARHPKFLMILSGVVDYLDYRLTSLLEKKFNFLNLGNVPNDWIIEIPNTLFSKNSRLIIDFEKSSNNTTWNSVLNSNLIIQPSSTAASIIINSKTELILQDNKVINNILISGYFFKMPILELDKFYRFKIINQDSASNINDITEDCIITFQFLYY